MITRTVDSPHAHGTILDQGAQVLSWQPTDGDECLYLSSTARREAGKAVRGGIPVVFPWFGPAVERGAPQHGFARLAPWRFVPDRDDAEAGTVRYLLTNQDAASPLWPHPYRATLTATFGAELLVALEVENAGDEAFTYEQALHTYLAVGDVESVTIDGLAGAPFWDKVTGQDGVGQGELRIDREVDRVYQGVESAVVDDPVLGRRLTVTASGGGAMVVWNPGQAKAAGIPDIGGEWRGFVCVEAGSIGVSAITLPAGESHTLTYRLSVEERP